MTVGGGRASGPCCWQGMRPLALPLRRPLHGGPVARPLGTRRQPVAGPRVGGIPPPDVHPSLVTPAVVAGEAPRRGDLVSRHGRPRVLAYHQNALQTGPPGLARCHHAPEPALLPEVVAHVVPEPGQNLSSPAPMKKTPAIPPNCLAPNPAPTRPPGPPQLVLRIGCGGACSAAAAIVWVVAGGWGAVWNANLFGGESCWNRSMVMVR